MRVYENGKYRDATSNETAEFNALANIPEIKIEELTHLLEETQVYKTAFEEGVISAEEYEPIRMQRQECLKQILELKAGGAG